MKSSTPCGTSRSNRRSARTSKWRGARRFARSRNRWHRIPDAPNYSKASTPTGRFDRPVKASSPRSRHIEARAIVRFGIFYEHQLPRPWDEESEYRLIQDALEQIEYADRIGIEYAWEV